MEYQSLGDQHCRKVNPFIVRVDNVGAIFMASNIITMPHTKQVDIRYKYVNEYVDDGVIKIIFVESTDNDSHNPKKNLCAELHEKHSKMMVDKKL